MGGHGVRQLSAQEVKIAALATAMSLFFLAALAVMLLPAFDSIGQPSASGISNAFLFRILLATSPRAIPGFKAPPVLKFGFNPGIGSGIFFESIWPLGDIRPLPASALIMSLASDSAADSVAGAGARTVLVTCLDAAFVMFQEIVALNGTTPVAMSSPCFRVLRQNVIATGSVGKNVGTILTSNGGTDFEVIAVDADENDGFGGTQTTAFTIPAEKLGFIGHLTFATSSETQGRFFSHVPGAAPTSFTTKRRGLYNLHTAILDNVSPILAGDLQRRERRALLEDSRPILLNDSERLFAALYRWDLALVIDRHATESAHRRGRNSVLRAESTFL